VCVLMEMGYRALNMLHKHCAIPSLQDYSPYIEMSFRV
jgi:hypothetical protein